MDSFSAPSSGSSSQMSTEDFMDQLKTQLAQAYAEEFLEREASSMTEALARRLVHLPMYIVLENRLYNSLPKHVPNTGSTNRTNYWDDLEQSILSSVIYGVC
ncbi:protein translocase subunit [Sarracenia purpurea var. burkii]